MEILLDPREARVLGALLEKEAVTPEVYPLSLNSLTAACNQKTSRVPVVDYDEDTVLRALELLRSKRLATMLTGNGRVTKYGQRLSETLNLGRRETALLTVLLLRGPQTAAELAARCERMHRFDDLAEAESCLEHLAHFAEGPLAVRLPRHPGQKEARWAHLLCGPVDEAAPSEPPRSDPAPSDLTLRFAALESEVASLREQLQTLERRWEEFRRQFE